MESRKITATSEQVAQHMAGPIVAVAYAGNYPPGSDGNDCAAEMASYLHSVLGTTNAAAVLFDLRGLQYTWGDAIGGLAGALLERSARIRPSAIVATGRTARSLERLLGSQFIFGVAGTRMFSTIPEALCKPLLMSPVAESRKRGSSPHLGDIVSQPPVPAIEIHLRPANHRPLVV